MSVKLFLHSIRTPPCILLQASPCPTMKDSDWVATFLTSRWQPVDRVVKPGESTFFKLFYIKAIRTEPITSLVTVTIFLSIVRLERQHINMAIEENPQNYLETREQRNAMLKWKLLITGFWNLLWVFFRCEWIKGRRKQNCGIGKILNGFKWDIAWPDESTQR